MSRAYGPARGRSIHDVLEWGRSSLSEEGFEESRLHAELLLAHALGMTRTELMMRGERTVSAEDVQTYSRLLGRRLAHEPLQYIVGETEFMGIAIAVDRRVLVPRPETELLVERALVWLRNRQGRRLRVLDIGTGSGCIAVAIARFAPWCDIVGIDSSPAALDVAAINVARRGASTVLLRQGDIFADPLPGEAFDCIVSNPPYVPAEDFGHLQPEVREFEPPAATTDGGDGLRFIRRIAEFASQRLVPGGRVFIEIGFGTAGSAREIIAAAGLSDAVIDNDLAGIERVISAQRPEPDRDR